MTNNETATIVGGEYDSMLRIKFQRENRRFTINADDVTFTRPPQGNQIELNFEGKTVARIKEESNGKPVMSYTGDVIIEMGITKSFYEEIKSAAKELQNLQR
jgi:hypothetical protein